MIETVHCALTNSKSSSSRASPSVRERFLKFATTVLYRAEVQLPIVLVALVYTRRAKAQLHISVEQWAYERVFLGAVILAYKVCPRFTSALLHHLRCTSSARQFCNDATLKNYHWAICTGVFGARDVGRIEREFLDVLSYRLCVTESDLLIHHRPIMSAVHPKSQISMVYPPKSPDSPIRFHKRSDSLVSCWSTAESYEVEMEDSDSCSSYESSSSPDTPEADMFDELACFAEVPCQPLHELPESVQLHNPYPSTNMKSVPVHSIHIQNQPSNSHLPLASSAFQFLRSFPLPFVSQSQPPVVPQLPKLSYPVPYAETNHSSAAQMTSGPTQLSHPSRPVPPPAAQWFPAVHSQLAVPRPTARIAC